VVAPEYAMNKLLKPETTSSSSPIVSHPLRRLLGRSIYTLLYLFTWVLVVLALVGGALLLGNDAILHSFSGLPHAPVSAAPLLLIGAASLGFQVLTRPKLLDLFKALLISMAFILWGIDQLLPASWLTTTVGDVVITLYVIDLGWMMIDRLRSGKSKGHSKGFP